jgi:hypothetical protein
MKSTRTQSVRGDEMRDSCGKNPLVARPEGDFSLELFSTTCSLFMPDDGCSAAAQPKACIVFDTILAHCFCIPFVQADALVAEMNLITIRRDAIAMA